MYIYIYTYIYIYIYIISALLLRRHLGEELEVAARRGDGLLFVAAVKSLSLSLYIYIYR